MLQRNAPHSVEAANLATAMAQLSGTPFTPPTDIVDDESMTPRKQVDAAL